MSGWSSTITEIWLSIINSFPLAVDPCIVLSIFLSGRYKQYLALSLLVINDLNHFQISLNSEDTPFSLWIISLGALVRISFILISGPKMARVLGIVYSSLRSITYLVRFKWAAVPGTKPLKLTSALKYIPFYLVNG